MESAQRKSSFEVEENNSDSISQLASKRKIRHERTKTLTLDQNLIEVKKAFKEQGEEVPTDDFLVDET